ncbi:MAG: hypothetical protein JU82_08810 [Sulfuricurvum sp. MLSB]|uniref:hypothetical protein n=1 Tax=Sulfuricurvum sp. MLSB TaxID=1537917 RepID=UPI0004FFF049|nr:hypothetical protein [Sulfuricurvum sp. MLSB]KFN39028.1 MAG: hypothetical protein JU82_08810 [Sulfuricurvum sp. MLSB]
MAAPKGNTNAEVWTFEKAEQFMHKAEDLSRGENYDFIGEVAYDLRTDKGTFDYIINKYPELKYLKAKILSNCEVNCFRNTKKGNINVAAGIINLKSNHGWKDRSDITTDDKPINPPIQWIKNESDS